MITGYAINISKEIWQSLQNFDSSLHYQSTVYEYWIVYIYIKIYWYLIYTHI